MPKITLRIIRGNLIGKTFVFDERTTSIMGRASDCNPQLPDSPHHRVISRYHCLLDINPPEIRIRDFGSKNGTYINGEKIGQREFDQSPEEGAQLVFPSYDIKHGDCIQVGNIFFQVQIQKDSVDLVKLREQHFRKGLSISNVTEWLDLLMKNAASGDPKLASLNNYQIQKLLAKTRFGEVYLAIKETTQQKVIIRIMSPQGNINEHKINEFLRALANIQSLNHPNIVKLYDYGEFQGKFYIIQEYCELGNIRDLMKRLDRNLTVSEALSILNHVLNGLEYAHGRIPYIGVTSSMNGAKGANNCFIHRDLRPEHIFLTKVNHKIVAKISNYGVTKAFDCAGLSGLSMSDNKLIAPAYAPRQQILKFNHAEPEVDVWAAAATLYFMLTGHTPRDFTPSEDPMLVVLTSNPVPIRLRNRSINEPLAELIDRALLDVPEIYFKVASDFKRALLNLKTKSLVRI